MMMKTELFWVVTQRVVSISYRRFRKTYRFHPFFLDSCPLKTGPIDCPKTSVRNYHNSLRNDPEERSSHLLRGGSLNSRDDDDKVLSVS
jgi:hypothetical protein